MMAVSPLRGTNAWACAYAGLILLGTWPAQRVAHFWRALRRLEHRQSAALPSHRQGSSAGERCVSASWPCRTLLAAAREVPSVSVLVFAVRSAALPQVTADQQ